MRLTRSRDNVIISGVLAGIANYFDVDPTLVRIGFVVLVFVGAEFMIPLYIISSFIIPEEPKEPVDYQNHPRDFKEKYSSKRKKSQNKKRDYHEANMMDKKSNLRDNSEDEWSDF